MLQSLVEKHFPAPDRQKLFSLLGIDLSAKKTPSPLETITEQKGKKRKGIITMTCYIMNVVKAQGLILKVYRMCNCFLIFRNGFNV